MRIYPSTVGLAAYVLGFVTADDEGPGLQMRAPSPVIDINTSEWVSPGIFSDDTHLQWTKSEGTKVLKAYIKNRAGNALASATATMSGGHSRQTSLAVAGRKRDSSSGQGAGTGGMTLEAADLDGNDSSNSGTTGSITFNLHVGNNPQESDFENVGAIGTPLYLQLDWMDYTNASVKGTTFSPLFAINNGSDISPSTISVLQAENFRDGASWVAVSNECWDPDCLASPSGSSTVPLETSAQPTASTITTSAATTTAAATATASASPGSGSTGLSIGAIAGIAVGCAVVGLALIGTAVWFLCFRRRHESHTALHQNTGYISDDMGPGVVNDKELPQITDSPHSAYAPDRSLHDPHEVSRNSMGVTGVGAGVGAGTGLMDGAGHAAHGAEVPYTPYSDHTPPPPGVIGTDRGPTSSQTSLPAGGTSSPTPISTRYAHLVEEGMTDDEIRRLEEEERALDMAIEDHGRSSRAQ